MSVGRDFSNKELEKLEKKLTKEYKTAQKEMQKKLKEFEKKFDKAQKAQFELMKSGKITQDQYVRWWYGQTKSSEWMKQQINGYAEEMTKANLIAADIINDRIPTVYAECFNAGVYELEQYAGVDTAFMLYNKDAVARLAKENPQLLPKSKIDIPKDKRWNKQKLNSALTQGIIQGESVPNITKRLQRITDMNRASAMRNARTMVNSAENAGKLDSYRRAEKLGIKLKKVWSATMDDRTRDSHAFLDGVSVGIEEEFPNGLMYPGDMSGSADEVWNCRCELSMDMEGFERDWTDLSLRNTDHFNYDSYDDWKKAHGEYRVIQGKWQKVRGTKVAPVKGTALKKATAKAYGNDWHIKNTFVEDRWNKLTDEQRYAVNKYTSNTYRKMNAQLRGLSQVERNIAHLVNECTDALEKSIIPEDIMVFRGMGEMSDLSKAMGITRLELNAAIQDGSIIGQRFTEKGFCSTGIDAASAWSADVKLNITCPKGTKGMYVDPISHFKGENELLLQQGTRFEITGFKYDNIMESYTFDVTVIEQAPKKLIK